jgi:hypothetical protein
MKSNIFIPTYLFILNGLLFYFFGSIFGYLKHIVNITQDIGFILDYTPIIIIPPILIVWQIYNIYGWKKNDRKGK